MNLPNNEVIYRIDDIRGSPITVGDTPEEAKAKLIEFYGLEECKTSELLETFDY